jgi:glucose-1-phosphate cytidylyltransferase
MTGGRLLRARKYLENDTFMLTYGDGVSDVNVDKLVSFHREHKRILSMTAIQPEGKFGALEIKSNSSITSFKEKPKGDGAWINGGFFVCNPKIFNYIKEGDQTILERNPLETLASEGELFAYKHSGFWQCMDTIRDKTQLTELWEKGKAPWKTWK